MEEELKIEEEPLVKEFYISVSYYEGNIPYAMISENKNSFKADRIFKVLVPYKDK